MIVIRRGMRIMCLSSLRRPTGKQSGSERAVFLIEIRAKENFRLRKIKEKTLCKPNIALF